MSYVSKVSGGGDRVQVSTPSTADGTDSLPDTTHPIHRVSISTGIDLLNWSELRRFLSVRAAESFFISTASLTLCYGVI